MRAYRPCKASPTLQHSVRMSTSGYKGVKGRSRSMDERAGTHSCTSHATSQPSLVSHTLSLTAQPKQQPTAPHIHDAS